MVKFVDTSRQNTSIFVGKTAVNPGGTQPAPASPSHSRPASADGLPREDTRMTKRSRSMSPCRVSLHNSAPVKFAGATGVHACKPLSSVASPPTLAPAQFQLTAEQMEGVSRTLDDAACRTLFRNPVRREPVAENFAGMGTTHKVFGLGPEMAGVAQVHEAMLSNRTPECSIIADHPKKMRFQSEVPPPLARGSVERGGVDAALDKFGSLEEIGRIGAQVLSEYKSSRPALDKLKVKTTVLQRRYDNAVQTEANLQRYAREYKAGPSGTQESMTFASLYKDTPEARRQKVGPIDLPGEQEFVDLLHELRGFEASHMASVPMLADWARQAQQVGHLLGGLPLQEFDAALCAKVEAWATAISGVQRDLQGQMPATHQAYKLSECVTDYANGVLAKTRLAAQRSSLRDSDELQKFMESEPGVSIQLMPWITEMFGPEAQVSDPKDRSAALGDGASRASDTQDARDVTPKRTPVAAEKPAPSGTGRAGSPPVIPPEIVAKFFNDDSQLASLRGLNKAVQAYVDPEAMLAKEKNSPRGLGELLARAPDMPDAYYKRVVAQARDVFSGEDKSLKDGSHLYGMRRALLAANAQRPEDGRPDLSDVENGAVFGSLERALLAGVPPDVAVRTYPEALRPALAWPVWKQAQKMAANMVSDKIDVLNFHGMTVEQIAKECQLRLDVSDVLTCVEATAATGAVSHYLAGMSAAEALVAQGIRRNGPVGQMMMEGGEFERIFNSPRMRLLREKPEASIQEIETEAQAESSHYADYPRAEMEDMLTLRKTMVLGRFQEAMQAGKPFCETARRLGLHQDDRFLPLMQEVATKNGVTDVQPDWDTHYATIGMYELNPVKGAPRMALSEAQSRRLEEGLAEKLKSRAAAKAPTDRGGRIEKDSSALSHVRQAEAAMEKHATRWCTRTGFEPAGPRGSVSAVAVRNAAKKSVDAMVSCGQVADAEVRAAGRGRISYPKATAALLAVAEGARDIAQQLDAVSVDDMDADFLAKLAEWDKYAQDMVTHFKRSYHAEPHLANLAQTMADEVANARQTADLAAGSDRLTPEMFIGKALKLPAAGPHLMALVNGLAAPARMKTQAGPSDEEIIGLTGQLKGIFDRDFQLEKDAQAAVRSDMAAVPQRPRASSLADRKIDSLEKAARPFEHVPDNWFKGSPRREASLALSHQTFFTEPQALVGKRAIDLGCDATEAFQLMVMMAAGRYIDSLPEKAALLKPYLDGGEAVLDHLSGPEKAIFRAMRDDTLPGLLNTYQRELHGVDWPTAYQMGEQTGAGEALLEHVKAPNAAPWDADRLAERLPAPGQAVRRLDAPKLAEARAHLDATGDLPGTLERFGVQNTQDMSSLRLKLVWNHLQASGALQAG